MIGRYRLAALAKLFRLSIAISPVADVVTGYAVFHNGSDVRPFSDPRLLAACAASMAAFCFGTGLNDYLDRHKDARLAPNRPLPSGALTPATALWATLVMAATALGLAVLAGRDTLTAMAVVLVLVASYNLATRRNDWLGVLNLGCIRAADLFVGISLVPGAVHSAWAWTGVGLPAAFVVTIYGAYGVALSAVALGERGQKGIHLTLPLIMAAGLALAPVIEILYRGFSVPAVILWLVLILPVMRILQTHRDPAVHLVGHLVSGFFLLGALFVLAKGLPVLCALLWALYFLSRALARWFPPA